MKSTKSEWDSLIGVLRTDLTGAVTVDDVSVWREQLRGELEKIPDGTTFRMLLNLHGFEPESIDAHKAMRTVVPEILISHGMRPAYIDLFDEKPEVDIKNSRGILCTAFANVHHDEQKMASYEERIGKPNQKFFNNLASAETWLRDAE